MADGDGDGDGSGGGSCASSATVSSKLFSSPLPWSTETCAEHPRRGSYRYSYGGDALSDAYCALLVTSMYNVNEDDGDDDDDDDGEDEGVDEGEVGDANDL